MPLGTRVTVDVGPDDLPKVLEYVKEDDSEISDVVVVDNAPALGTVGSPSTDVISVAAANGLFPVTATIAESGSLSAEIDLGAGRVLCAIDMPADWTAAILTFQASPDSDGTFDNLYDQYGTEKTVYAAEDRYISLDDPSFWLGVRYLKVRSGTASSPVAQTRTGGTTITLVTKPV